MAKTVPGTAQGMAIIPSSAPPSRSRRMDASRAAANPSARARTVAAVAIQSELTTGRRCSGVVNSDAQLPKLSTGGKGSAVQVKAGTRETSRSTA